jgi:hypothetical protein
MEPQHDRVDAPWGLFWYVLGAVLLALFLVGYVMPMYLFTDWFGKRAAVSRSPIGHLVALRAHGGWGSRLVIETEIGFYPVRDDVAGAKGVAFFLERRHWGPHFILRREPHDGGADKILDWFMP